MILLVAAALAGNPVLVWDLEQDDGAFQATGELGQWRWGHVSAGPGSAFDGTRAWAVGLSGNYLNDSVEYLEVPLPALDAVAQPVFSFAHWYGFGSGDVGYVEVDEGSGFRRVSPIYGYPSGGAWSGTSSGWEQVSFVLPAIPAARLRFVFSADAVGSGVGWFVDQVGVWDGDVTAPHFLGATGPVDNEDLDGPHTVTVSIEDDTGVDAVTVVWTDERGGSGEVDLTAGGDGSWSGGLPAALPDTRVSYHLLATDGANVARYPDAGELSFRVYLPAPTGLDGPAGRVVATEAVLTWVAPLSAHEVLGYEVWRGDEQVGDTTSTTFAAPLSGIDDTFTVRGVYAAGVGDASAPFTVGAVVPSLLRVEPDRGYAGEELRLDLYGRDALFVAGEAEVDFGVGVVVDAVDVRNVDRLVATVAIDGSAAVGARDVVLSGATGELTLPAGFTVVDASLRPRIVSVVPDHATQGDSVTLRVVLSTAPAAIPTVDLGEGVVVERVVLEGDELLVDCAIAVRAPLGEHELVVDDGVRWLTGGALEVRDWSPPPIDSCATAPGAGGVALGATVLVVLRRRRRAG